MTMPPDQVALTPLTFDQALEIVQGARDDRRWAADFPTDGDLRIATVIVDGRAAPVSGSFVWGPYVIVEQSTGLYVGGIGIKGAPNDLGEVEIGYGVCASRHRRGYGTESIGLVCSMAGRAGASVVVAETDPENEASQRLLMKSGFLRDHATAESVWWRKGLYPG
jgi:RimJ/RimL family protein N-acetyltransferase